MLKRFAFLLALTIAITACGSGSPTAPAPSTPAPAPAPAPPPAPTFPSLVGQWTGTMTFIMAVVIPSSQSVTETCNTTWNGTQLGGTFSGTVLISPSTATNATNCSGGSNYTGTVTTTGAVSIPNLNWAIFGVTWIGTPLNAATCGLKAVSVPLAGTVSGRSWSMTQKDSWLCINNTVQVDRTILVQLTQ